MTNTKYLLLPYICARDLVRHQFECVIVPVTFLDIKDPAKRVTLVKEYVTTMKTVKQRNMVNREKKLAIGDKLQTLFHLPIRLNKRLKRLGKSYRQ